MEMIMRVGIEMMSRRSGECFGEKVKQSSESNIYFLAMKGMFLFCLESHMTRENGILVGQEGLNYICWVWHLFGIF